ncbi:MAG: hypothetical protein WCJ02_04330 [bacterium]
MKYRIMGCFFLCAFLTGCLTMEQLIAKRIAAKADYFASLPAESQERLRKGHLQIGDAEDAAWIVFGSPSRRSIRVTAGSTNTVWSYVMTEAQPVDELHPVAYPIMTRRGHMIWGTDYQYYRSYVYERNEYLRIEFNNNKVSAIDKAEREQ